MSIKPLQTVGVYTERSIDSIIGFLASLKAGCIYLPLSLKNPLQRLSFIAEEAQLAVLLTQEKLKNNLHELAIAKVSIDSEWETIGKENTENLAVNYEPHHLAYIIYTSGTTGNPKGVKVTHESLINFFDSMNENIYADQIKKYYRVGFYSNLDFDASFKQLLQLLNGHTLHIVPEELRRDINGLINFLEKNEIQALDCPTTLIKELLHFGLLENKNLKLKKVYFGGDSIDEVAWNRMAGEKTIEFYNMYGPTECTVDATMTRIKSTDEKPHMGKPILNTVAYILDEHMQEVSDNEAGELYIGGKCLAQGYLGSEELTNQKFIYASFGSEKNIRLYRTGDLVRRLPNGNIEFIGRADRQVKINGYRIELKEIEAVIRRCNNVADIVVKAVNRTSAKNTSDNVLAAYLAPNDKSTFDMTAFRKSLVDKLPEYMIPLTFQLIDTIPLTHNGKIDYNALPMPVWDNLSSLSENHAEAETETLSSLEKYLIDVWKESLGIEHLGCTDNFFEKGGHSLIAMRITAELQDYFDTDIPLISLFFESPTVKAFAKAIEDNMESPEKINEILAEIMVSKN